MKQSEYRRLTEKELKGRRIELIKPINNRYMRLAPGVFGTIHAKWKGLEIHFDRCQYCGSQPIVSRVSPVDIILLSEVIAQP
ncbi:hypothetical protein ES703_104774 [subsurface metagenome]